MADHNTISTLLSARSSQVKSAPRNTPPQPRYRCGRHGTTATAVNNKQTGRERKTTRPERRREPPSQLRAEKETTASKKKNTSHVATLLCRAQILFFLYRCTSIANPRTKPALAQSVPLPLAEGYKCKPPQDQDRAPSVQLQYQNTTPIAVDHNKGIAFLKQSATDKSLQLNFISETRIEKQERGYPPFLSRRVCTRLPSSIIPKISIPRYH